MTSSKRTVKVSIVNEADGIVRYEDSGVGFDIDVRVERRKGRLVITELHIADGIDAETLRKVPIGTIDTAINYDPTIAQAFMGEDHIDWIDNLPRSSVQRPSLKIKNLPPAGSRDDGFYRTVAELYRWCIGNSVRNPAIAIAEANGVPVTTVHGWIRDARRKEFLPAARRGKVG